MRCIGIIYSIIFKGSTDCCPISWMFNIKCSVHCLVLESYNRIHFNFYFYTSSISIKKTLAFATNLNCRYSNIALGNNESFTLDDHHPLTPHAQLRPPTEYIALRQLVCFNHGRTAFLVCRFWTV